MVVTMSTAPHLHAPPTPPLDPVTFEAHVAPAVEGWFQPADVRAFLAVDRMQGRLGTTGDILEIGTFMGRSAILLGSLLRPGEQLVVNDLWDALLFDPDEWHCFDGPVAQRGFEANYLRFHPRLPEIVCGSSTSALRPHPDATCRFVHV